MESTELLVVGCGPAGRDRGPRGRRAGVATVVLERDPVVGAKRVCAAGLRPGFCETSTCRARSCTATRRTSRSRPIRETYAFTRRTGADDDARESSTARSRRWPAQRRCRDPHVRAVPFARARTRRGRGRICRHSRRRAQADSARARCSSRRARRARLDRRRSGLRATTAGATASSPASSIACYLEPAGDRRRPTKPSRCTTIAARSRARRSSRGCFPSAIISRSAWAWGRRSNGGRAARRAGRGSCRACKRPALSRHRATRVREEGNLLYGGAPRPGHRARSRDGRRHGGRARRRHDRRGHLRSRDERALRGRGRRRAHRRGARDPAPAYERATKRAFYARLRHRAQTDGVPGTQAGAFRRALPATREQRRVSPICCSTIATTSRRRSGAICTRRRCAFGAARGVRRLNGGRVHRRAVACGSCWCCSRSRWSAFVFMHLIPGDPIAIRLGEHASPQQIALAHARVRARPAVVGAAREVLRRAAARRSRHVDRRHAAGRRTARHGVSGDGRADVRRDAGGGRDRHSRPACWRHCGRVRSLTSSR